MNLVFRTTILSAWILAVGLIAVSLESQEILIGHRIQNLLEQREKLVEKVRRLEIRYNRMVSPDLLERELPESFQPEGRSMAAGGKLVRN